MKTASNAIRSLLASESAETCDLYTLTLLNNAVYRFASYSSDVSFGGVTYDHKKFIFKRQQVKLSGAPSVDTLGVTIYCQPDDTIGGVPFMKACHDGALDQSTMLLSRAYFYAGACVGVLDIFSGRCEVHSSGGLCVNLNIKSVLQGLAAPIPVRMFASQAAYVNSNGVITTSSHDTTSMVIPLKPSGNVLLRI